MDIRQLEGFLWISRLGSVTAACKRLNVTQSAISMRLRALEDELQVELFDRSHKKLTLTAKGQDLIKYAEEIVRTFEQIRLNVASSSVDLGKLRIGMSELVGLTWGSSLASMLIKRYPNISVDLEIGVPAVLMDDLVTKKLDVLIAPTIDSPPDSLKVQHLGQVEFAWMEAGGAKGRDNNAEQKSFFQKTVIGYDNDKSLLFPAIRRTLGENDVKQMRFIGCNSIATTLEMVIKGNGISLLPTFYCRSLIDSGTLRVILDNTHSYDYYAMCRAKDMAGVAGVVLDLARELFIQEIGEGQASPVNQKR